MESKNENGNALTKENFTQVMQRVKDKLVLSKQGAGGADFFDQFEGKQLVTTVLFQTEKEKNKNSNNPQERNNFRLLYDAQKAIEREVELNNSERSQEIVIEDDHALQTRTDSNENFKILSLLKRHIRGKRALLPHLTQKYKNLDYSRYSDSLLIALREVYQSYSPQVHAALTPILDGNNARHQQALTQARGNGWKLLRLLRESNQDTGRNEIVTKILRMLALNFRTSDSGTRFLNVMEQATTEVLASIKEHENLNGKTLSAMELVLGLALDNTRTKLHQKKNLQHAIQSDSQSNENIFTKQAMTSIQKAVSTAESLSGIDGVDQEVAATATSTSSTSYAPNQQQTAGSHRQELHGIFADKDAARQLNEGRGPGFPRQHHAPGVSLYYDYKEYLHLTGQGAVATTTAQEWAKTNGLFPDKNAITQRQRNSQSIPNNKNWKTNVKKTIAAMVAKQLKNGNKRGRPRQEEEDEHRRKRSRSPNSSPGKRRRRGDNSHNNGSDDDIEENESFSNFASDNGELHSYRERRHHN